MLGGDQFKTGGLGPVPYLNILGGTSKKNHPVLHRLTKLEKRKSNQTSESKTWLEYVNQSDESKLFYDF